MAASLRLVESPINHDQVVDEIVNNLRNTLKLNDDDVAYFIEEKLKCRSAPFSSNPFVTAKTVDKVPGEDDRAIYYRAIILTISCVDRTSENDKYALLEKLSNRF